MACPTLSVSDAHALMLREMLRPSALPLSIVHPGLLRRPSVVRGSRTAPRRPILHTEDISHQIRVENVIQRTDNVHVFPVDSKSTAPKSAGEQADMSIRQMFRRRSSLITPEQFEDDEFSEEKFY